MITTKEASLRLGLTERTIRNYCSKGRLKCEKRGKIWYIEESSLDDVLEVKVVGTEETERKIGTEYDEPSSKSLALPPYYLLVRENGYLKAQVDIFKNQIEELKNRIKLLEEQLTYQKTSWIKRLFKR
ncbi:unnamed protein product [marine sediment metagenome]|uniref:Helix-turn-helix domain-containing protein n=1 Tax=marine sediment metagenome TaxID=412755 RepID=X1J1P7_9ZZZZ